VIEYNAGAAISVDVDALDTQQVPDWGRQTGPLGAFTQFNNNDGPLVRLNQLDDNGLNGMVVRGGELEAQDIWDDTDIVHVVEGTVTVPNFQSVGGLRIQSSATQSLVIKMMPGAGFDAGGSPGDITDRIGGEIQIIGTPNHPVIITSYRDNTVGAGLTPSDQPDNETWPGPGNTIMVGGTLVASSGIFVGPPAVNSAGIAPPVETPPSFTFVGGTMQSGTYYYVVTAITATGETTASNEEPITFNIPRPQGTVAVNWTAVAGATGYKIYRGTVVGGENVLVGAVNNGNATSFTDFGNGAAPGDWNSVLLDQYSNDRNVAMIDQSTAGPTPATAQALGQLAQNQQSGDDNIRLGFQVNGYLSSPTEVDTYTFQGTAGTQAWITATNTSPALDSVVELVDANGNVLARSDNSNAEQQNATSNGDPLQSGPLLNSALPGNLAQPIQDSNTGVAGEGLENFWSTNQNDPGFRVTLPGTAGTQNNYYVRVYSKGPSGAPPTTGAAGPAVSTTG
ncbi:MAG: hypothetical protein ACREHD_27700, partial [Pirellulales bacterium]